MQARCGILPRQPFCLGSPIQARRIAPSLLVRRSVVTKAEGGKNWWEKITGSGGANDKSSSGPGGSGASGGSGGVGGFGKFGGSSAGGGDEEQPIWQEFLQLMHGIWVVVVNTAIFLGFANMLHRSLDWCCQIELLLLVGAPQQAFERVASVVYGAIEGFEKNVLGWDIPGDDDMIPMYENLALYYPEEHAYTFDAYRYDMTEAEKKKMKYFYALRHYERDGGVPGEVDAADVQAIIDKYEPMEADRRAYVDAKANGTLEEYWAAREGQYRTMLRGG